MIISLFYVTITAVLTFKVLHDSVPRYLGPLAVADLPGRRALRSANTSRL